MSAPKMDCNRCGERGRRRASGVCKKCYRKERIALWHQKKERVKIEKREAFARLVASGAEIICMWCGRNDGRLVISNKGNLYCASAKKCAGSRVWMEQALGMDKEDFILESSYRDWRDNGMAGDMAHFRKPAKDEYERLRLLAREDPMMAQAEAAAVAANLKARALENAKRIARLGSDPDDDGLFYLASNQRRRWRGRVKSVEMAMSSWYRGPQEYEEIVVERIHCAVHGYSWDGIEICFFAKGKWANGLRVGDVFEFDARVKSWWDWNECHWKLLRPTKIKNLGRVDLG